MKKIIVCNFLSIDCVMQAPGGPDEDTSGNFPFGGWTAPHWDAVMEETMARHTAAPYDLLLGRHTYEIFAGYWPHHTDNPTGELFSRIKKYVAATTPLNLSWEGSVLLEGDVAEALKKLKTEEGPDLLVWGSSKLVQSLLKHQLVDILHTWVFPVTLGTGKKLFAEGMGAQQWKLLSSVTSTTGVMIGSYAPDGEVKTGSL